VLARLSATIILALLWFTQANATTTTYDYGNRTPGTNIFAYEGELDDNSVPPGNATTPNSQISIIEYGLIATNDSLYDFYSVGQNGRRATQRYVFQIEEVEASVSQIDILWNGAGQNGHHPRTDGVELFIWNYTSGSYESIANSGDTESVVNLTPSISSNITNYIGGASNNEITLFSTSNDKRTGNRSNILWLDFIKVDITAAATPSIHHYEIEHDGTGSTCATESVTIKACENAACTVLSTQSVSLNLQVDGSMVASPTFTGSTTVNYNHLVSETVALSIDSPSITPDNSLVCDNTSGGSSCNQAFTNTGCAACLASFPSGLASAGNNRIVISGNPTIDDNTGGILTTTNLLVSGNPDCLDGVGQNCTQSGTSASSITLQANSSTTALTTSTNFTAGDHYYGTMTLAGGDNLTVSGGGTTRLHFNGDVNLNGNSNINASGTPEQLVIYVDGNLNMPGNGTYNAIFYVTGHVSISGSFTLNGALTAEGEIAISGSPNINYSSSYISSADLGTNCAGEPSLSVHHYLIEHDGSGLTCSPESVTIKACMNSDCSVLSTTPVSLDFQGGGNTFSSPNFTGSTTVSFNHTTAEVLTLAVANASVPATNSIVCDSGGSSCDIEFFDSGFVFDVLTQTSCEASSEIVISAVKKDDVTQKCVPGFSNVSKTLKFWTDYVNPNTGNKKVSLTQGGNDYELATSKGTDVSVGFDVDGEAKFTVSYPDAGQLRLNASYDGSGDDAGLSMAGEDLFVTVPAKLVVTSPDANATCGVNDITCSVFKAAGDSFNLNIEAQCDGGTPTPNYQPQANNRLELSVQQEAPTVALGALTIASSGVVIDATNNTTTIGKDVEVSNLSLAVNYSEVGIINIAARDTDYLGTPINFSSYTTIGRFIPDHFELAEIEGGSLTSICESVTPNIAMPFVYNGQMQIASPTRGAIRYGAALLPEFTITAKSALCPGGNCSTTQNYTGDYMRLLPAGVIRVVPTSDVTTNGKDGATKLNLTAQLNDVTLSEASGIVNYQFDGNDNFVYTKEANAERAPVVESDIDLVITSVTDQDSVTANDTNGAGIDGVLTLEPTGIEVRFGRITLENAYGPETSPLPVPMMVQYFDGTHYVNNVDDTCTIPGLTDKEAGAIHSGGLDLWDYRLVDLDATDTLEVIETSGSISGGFEDGVNRNFIFGSPGQGNQGGLQLEYQVPSWLQYDWVTPDSFTANPTAILSFGLYRGNDRIIYWREVNN